MSIRSLSARIVFMKNKNITHPALRLLAYLIDLSLLAIVPIAFVEIASRAYSVNSLLSSLLALLTLMISWTPLVYPLIQIVAVSRLGGTIGKLLCGIKIVDKDGKHLNLRYAFFRNYIGYLVSGLLFNLGFVWILVDKERRGWHDQISGSWVVVKQKAFVWIGLLTFLLLLTINISLGNSIYKNIIQNSSLYQNIYQDAYTEIQNILKSTELEEGEEVNLEEFDFEGIENIQDLNELEMQMKELQKELEKFDDLDHEEWDNLEDVDYEASPQTEIS